MKKFIGISLFISACLLGSCSSYDDERIWQDLNDIEQTIGDYESLTRTLNEQMSSLSEVLGSSFITLISQDADGNYVISYSNSGGETHTVTLDVRDLIKTSHDETQRVHKIRAEITLPEAIGNGDGVFDPDIEEWEEIETELPI